MKKTISKFEMLTDCGLKNGHIKKFDDEILERLSNIYIGNIPTIMLLLNEEYSSIFCDRNELLWLCLKDTDTIYVSANVDSVRYDPNLDNATVYNYFQRKMDDGSVWIYDTKTLFMYDKEFYDIFQSPYKLKMIPVNDDINYPFNYETDIKKVEENFTLRKLEVSEKSYYYDELNKYIKKFNEYVDSKEKNKIKIKK